MKFRFAVALMLLAASPSFAEENPGYTKQQLSAFTVAGVKTGMTESEALKILKEAGYTGSKFAPLRGQFEEEAGGVGKNNGKEIVFLYRYKHSDGGEPRIWRVVYSQKFDDVQSDDVMMKKMVERYGNPTEVGTSNLQPGIMLFWRSEFLIENIERERCNHKSFRSSSKCQNLSKERARVEAAFDGLHLEGNINQERRTISITLSDAITRKLEGEKISTKAEADREAAAKKNSEKTKVGF